VQAATAIRTRRSFFSLVKNLQQYFQRGICMGWTINEYATSINA
jgi:hypothetical protein